MRLALTNAVTALQAFGLMLPSETNIALAPRSTKERELDPRISKLFKCYWDSPQPLTEYYQGSSEGEAPSDNSPPPSNVSMSRRRSTTTRAPKTTVTVEAIPDLSFISEGDEPSMGGNMMELESECDSADETSRCPSPM